MGYLKNTRVKVCSKEELEQFVSIYNRFKQMMNVSSYPMEDFDYKQLELIKNIRDFWPVINKIINGLTGNMLWKTSLASIQDVILLARGNIQSAYDPLPRGAISLETKEWENRRLTEASFDSLMIELCKYFNVEKKDFGTNGILKRKWCTINEFLRFKSIHKDFNFLIENQSNETTLLSGTQKQTELLEDIEDFWPRLNTISRLLNVPFGIDLVEFRIIILGVKSLTKAEKNRIYSKSLYENQDFSFDEILTIESDCLKNTVKENLDEIVIKLRKYFDKNEENEKDPLPDHLAKVEQGTPQKSAETEQLNKTNKEPEGKPTLKNVISQLWELNQALYDYYNNEFDEYYEKWREDADEKHIEPALKGFTKILSDAHAIRKNLNLFRNQLVQGSELTNIIDQLCISLESTKNEINEAQGKIRSLSEAELADRYYKSPMECLHEGFYGAYEKCSDENLGAEISYLENNFLKEQAKSGEAAKRNNQLKLHDLKNPIKCTEVAAIVRGMSHNIAAKLKRHEYPVVQVARKNYCEVEHAAILYPKKRKALEKYKKNAEE